MIGETFAILAAITWAISSIFDKKALEKISPFTANTLRSIPALIFTFILMIVFEGFDVFFSISLIDILLIIIASSLSLILGDLLFLYSLQKMGVAKALPLASIYPLFAILFATLLLGEVINYLLLTGAIAIIFGIWFLSRTNKQKNNNTKNKYFFLIPILVAFFWGLGQTIFGLVLITTAPLTMTTIRLFYFSIALVLINFIKGDKYFYKKYNTIPGKLATIGGFLALGLGGLFFILALDFIGVSRTTPLSSITPLFSIIFAVIFLKEKINLRIIAGTILTVSGVIIITIIYLI